MSPDELESWLESDESKDSGWTNGEGGESVGHQSGRTIVSRPSLVQRTLSPDALRAAVVCRASGNHASDAVTMGMPSSRVS